MNKKQQTFGTSKKVLLTILGIVWIISLSFLLYALVYASEESLYKKNALIIGFFLIAVTSIMQRLYSRFKKKDSL